MLMQTQMNMILRVLDCLHFREGNRLTPFCWISFELPAAQPPFQLHKSYCLSMNPLNESSHGTGFERTQQQTVFLLSDNSLTVSVLVS